jgi:hypothetical protein
MKKCVYCGSNEKLTKEHIFPRWVLKRQPESNVRFSRHENRVSERVPNIRDVCAHCNNVVLSELDNYMLSLYDRYFYKAVSRNGKVTFEYDYDLLSRWLLKVVYNSARKNNSRPDELEPFRDYILGKSDRPPTFRVFSLLLTPHRPSSNTLKRLGREQEHIVDIPPRNISITQFGVQISEENMLLLARAVLFNSFCFAVSILPFDIPRHVRRQALKDITDNLQRNYDGIQVIDPRFNKARLYASKMDLLEMKKDSLSLFRSAYEEYYERRRKKESAEKEEALFN